MYFINSHPSRPTLPKPTNTYFCFVIQALVQTTHSSRQTIEDRSEDDYPVVHDYFYESEESFFDNGDSRREYSNVRINIKEIYIKKKTSIELVKLEDLETGHDDKPQGRICPYFMLLSLRLFLKN